MSAPNAPEGVQHPTPIPGPAVAAAEAYGHAEDALLGALGALADSAKRLRTELRYNDHLPTGAELAELGRHLAVVCVTTGAAGTLRDVGEWLK